MSSPAVDNVIHGSAGVSVSSAAVSIFDPTTLSMWLAAIAALISITLGLHRWYVIVRDWRETKRKRLTSGG